MGGCKNENEGLFLKFLGRLPIDVLILRPNLDKQCYLKDELLYEINNTESLEITKFPEESSNVRIGTVAYYAERELDQIMYQDSGIYRNKQYKKASIINLQTMYEEIKILWDQEIKYRPNFSVSSENVNIPVIFAKICGVKDGLVSAYWNEIKQLITEDTIIIKDVPFVKPTDNNPIKPYSTKFLRNGRLQIKEIKNHKSYKYGLLKEEIQDYILEKLQQVINKKLIKGTFENGTEYTIISTILNLPKDILRLIQQFDFTKKNPKIVYINTGEQFISLEDSIIISFLNLVGFDILFFVPTGYESIEKYFNNMPIEKHEIGNYIYDLNVPDFNRISVKVPYNWRNIFNRGR